MWLKLQYEKGKLTKNKLIERRLNTFRTIRAEKFKAFDIWERAVIRGREVDNQEVMNWYQEMLDFPDLINEDTTNEDYPTTPEVLKKYL